MYFVGCKDNDFMANNVDFYGFAIFFERNFITFALTITF